MDCQNCTDCKFTEGQKEIWYEIHITVDYNQRFIDYCKGREIKVVHIELGEEIPTQLMTSHSVKEDPNKGILDVMGDMVKDFQQRGFNVIREKIETVPWHPMANGTNYFESHLAYHTSLPETLAKNLHLHKSRNLMKTKTGTVQMYTLRKHSLNAHSFKEHVDHTVDVIRQHTQLEPDKIIIEYALYDSNEKLDHKWMKNE